MNVISSSSSSNNNSSSSSSSSTDSSSNDVLNSSSNDDIITIISIVSHCNNNYSNKTTSSTSASSTLSTLSTLSTTITNINDFIPWARALRNTITSNTDKDVAYYLQQERVIITIARICKTIAISKFTSSNIDDGNDDSIKTCSMITLYLCQFVANFTACSDDQKQWLWCSDSDDGSYMIEYLRDMLAAAVNTKNRVALAAITAAIHNSISYSNCDIKGTLCANMTRGLCCQLMLAIIDCKYNNDDDNDPLIEWLLFIAFKLARQGCLSQFFELIGPTDTSTTSITITHEQVVFLQIIRTLFEDRSCTDDIINSNLQIENVNDESDLIILLKRLTSIMSIITMSINFNDKTIEQQIAIESLPIIMSIIGTTLAGTPKSRIGDDIRSQLSVQNEGHLLHFCFQIISSRKYFNGKFIWNDDCILNNLYGKGGDLGWDDNHKEMIKLSLEIIGNVAYGCRTGQDKIYELGGIPLLLASCATDFDNPLAREWALMSIRNCCEGNTTNQDYIDGLKVQGVVQGMNGVNIDINTKTGKFQFKKEES